jgi:predicted alpha/beta hydrolase
MRSATSSSGRPRDFGVKRIGHEGAFRRGMEPLWEEILDWFDDGLPGAPPDA